MADLSREDIVKIARLARISLSDDEIDRYAAELVEIIRYVEQLQSIDVSGLKPTNQVTGLVNVMRQDVVQGYSYEPRDLLGNVPNVEDDHIKVRRMVG
ncbi:MAG TPA: Asp-tRNA(Asn)/Glu-tRNA(Gln) amidotransferase subunit GatC [Candidatus Limnocylindrales bacterium]|nr:Asp-tRNA(Asn)/Glu-tRNA(Gln) amidotransferase subunit GatC [Candidatus Limnocylindrales bacterium]